MTEPTDPRAALADIDAARQRAVAHTLRPRWLDAVMAVLVGLAFALLVYDVEWWTIVPALALAVGVVGLSWWAERRRGRLGRLTDERATTSGMGRSLLSNVVMLPFILLRPVPAPWWYVLLAGVLGAAITYAAQRADQAYQARRIAAGDYGRYDMT